MGRLWLAGLCSMVLCCIGGTACAEDAGMPVMSAPATAAMEPDIEWLWGEVVSVDDAAGSLTVKYLDYETDEEKEMVLATDAKTIIENAAALNAIHSGDTVSVDYMFEGSGKTLARNISVEKAEGPAPAAAASASASEMMAAAPATPAAPVTPDVLTPVVESAVATQPIVAQSAAAQPAAEKPAAAEPAAADKESPATPASAPAN